MLANCSVTNLPVHRCTSPRGSVFSEQLRFFAKKKSGGQKAATGVVTDNIRDVDKIRNIGISAHIDSGKTTLTERILYYTGEISSIHEVRGKDGVGATMDHMELEREKGITIQSAATTAKWKDLAINIIDTPGHVDFTIEVERSLRVLDGAVLVLCGVSGVQSQTITVDRQMKRYNVPRLAFVNKLDRKGADPFRIVDQLREQLNLNAAAVQIPIGRAEDFTSVIDVIDNEKIDFEGTKGEIVKRSPVPPEFAEQVEQVRQDLISRLGEFDEDIEMMFLEEEEPSNDEIKEAIRRGVISREFVPVYMGTAFKNKGVQPLLDAVADYLPNPSEVENTCLDQQNDEAEIVLDSDPSKELVALAFKLDESPFGQLTWLRLYQGTIKKGQTIKCVENDRLSKVKVSRIGRLSSKEFSTIDAAGAGDIIAMFGVECNSGHTFMESNSQNDYTMSTMFVPDPVMSIAVSPKKLSDAGNFRKAVAKFIREDPTFRYTSDEETNQTLFSGMGELHLEVYMERLKREFGVECRVGEPKVAYQECITQKANFDYLHKKQTGGRGQYGRVIGTMEPMEPNDPDWPFKFVNDLVGEEIPPEFVSSVEKGFKEACEAGPLIGKPVEGVKITLTGGAAHEVDSSDMAFKLTAMYAFSKFALNAGAQILEPVMAIEVTVPLQMQQNAMMLIGNLKGVVSKNEVRESFAIIHADVTLKNMFGFSTSLRSCTEGKGEFSMTYKNHQAVDPLVQEQLMSGDLE